MKLGIIRCLQTEDFCPGTGCFRALREKNGALADIEEEIEIIGFIDCGAALRKSRCFGQGNW